MGKAKRGHVQDPPTRWEKRLDYTWRKAVSFAINKAMRHNKALPIHPAGFCFPEDIAHALTIGGNLHRMPTQLEIMQVISAEDVGRFEGTCIEGNWPPRERDVLARCVQGHSLSPAQGLSDDAIHSKYTADTAKTGPLLFHYTRDKLLYPILESGFIVPGGAHTPTNPCVYVSPSRVGHRRDPRQIHEANEKHMHRAR